MTATACLLSADDLCHRAGWRSLRRPVGPQGVLPILREAVDIGLGARDDRPERAAMAVRDAALGSRLEVDGNLYQISEHLAAIAEQIVYVVGGETPWVRPDSMRLDDNLSWEPGVWVDGSGSGLRRVVLATYQGGERLSWFEQGEQAMYGAALTKIVVILGGQREGRLHGYWSKGWKHPQSREIRLADRDGGTFRSWNPIWREDERISPEEWTAKMQPVMASALRIEQREPLSTEERKAWRALAIRKLAAMRSGEEPDPQISQCARCPYGPCSV